MNITNPKVSLFFLSFLPTFTSQKQGPAWQQLIALGFVFMLATLVVFGTIAIFAGSFGRLLKRSTMAQQILNWLSATVFVLLAIAIYASIGSDLLVQNVAG